MMGTADNSGRSRRYKGIGAVELLEQATGLVRRSSARDLCCYYLGSLPFVLGLLAFVGRMGSAGTAARLMADSFILALLFIWMKYWQAVYARGLRAGLLNADPPPVSPLRVAVVQGSLQPWGVLVLPVALILTLPFGWCYAFFQNVTVLGAEGDFSTVLGKARRQAMLFPGQNVLAILIVLALSLVLFLNLIAASFFIPYLLKVLFGVETAFSRSYHFLLNTTFLAAVASLTYLLADPFLKAVYVLRCFHGESLESGADLMTELRELRGKAAGFTAIFLVCAAVLAAPAFFPSAAISAPVSVARQGTPDAGELDRAIDRVLKKPEFQQLPGPGDHKPAQVRLPGFLTSITKTVKEWVRSAGRQIGKFIEWLVEHLARKGVRDRANERLGGRGWTIYAAMYALTAAILSFLGVAIWRRMRNRKPAESGAEAPLDGPVPDIGDESVTAEQLSVDRWRILADELLVRGETRLALRALYFACIVRLAEAGLLTMDKAKSDRDYEKELRRRAHSLPALREAFSANVAVFQRTWYGMHEASMEMVELFRDNYRRIAGNEG